MQFSFAWIFSINCISQISKKGHTYRSSHKSVKNQFLKDVSIAVDHIYTQLLIFCLFMYFYVQGQIRKSIKNVWEYEHLLKSTILQIIIQNKIYHALLHWYFPYVQNLWKVFKISERCSKSLRGVQNLWEVFKISERCSKSLRGVQNPWEVFEIFERCSKSLRGVQNLREVFKISERCSKFLRGVQNPWEAFKIFERVFNPPRKAQHLLRCQQDS